MSLLRLTILYICTMLTIAACAYHDPQPKWQGYQLQFEEREYAK